MNKEALLQYDIGHDRSEQDQDYIALQLQTHLRERFNVLVSTVEYEIRDGHLVGKGRKEPAIASIRRGRDHIQRLSPSAIDFDRENAEVEAFEAIIDPYFSNLQTPIGSKMISISLRGEEESKYQHNFYDIFTLRYRNAQRVVELSRFSSALESKDYAQRLPGYDQNNPPTADQWLRSPIIVPNIFVTAEQVHEAFHKKHEYMAPQAFEEIWVTVQPLIRHYLVKRDAESFNAILNFADDVWESNKKREMGKKYQDYSGYIPSSDDMYRLGNREVRQVSTACPGESGARKNSLWSVADHAEGTILCCTCPKCGKEVEAVIANSTITCPKCKASAPWKTEPQADKGDRTIPLFGRESILLAA